LQEEKWKWKEGNYFRNGPKETGIHRYYHKCRKVDEGTMTDLAELKNNFESKCSIKIETNSRGHNTSIHVYQGIIEKEIDDAIFKAIYGINGLQKELAALE